MRKIHPGFKALAILLGPASLIIGHQKITQVLEREALSPSDPAALVQKAYTCADEAQPQSTFPCNGYLRLVERCAALEDRCDPQVLDEVLTKLNFSPSQLQEPTVNTVAVAEN
jgi:hypothetical protein